MADPVIDEQLLEDLDGGLSKFIAGGVIDDKPNFDLNLETLSKCCRDQKCVDELILKESDFLYSLVGFLRAGVESSASDISYSTNQVLDSVTKVYRNSSHTCKADLREFTKESGVSEVVEKMLVSKQSVRLCVELICRISELTERICDKQQLLSEIENYMRSLLKNQVNDAKKFTELKISWNCFLVLDAKEKYGEALLTGNFSEVLKKSFSKSLEVSIEDVCYITENGLVNKEFRNSLLQDVEFVELLAKLFHGCFLARETEILKHLVVVIRNMFFDMDIENPGWIVYEEAHLIIKRSNVPSDLRKIICGSDNKGVKFFAIELASYNFVDLDLDENKEILKEISSDLIQWLLKAIDAPGPGKSITIPGTEYHTSAYNLVSLLARVSYNDDIKLDCVRRGLIEKLFLFIQSPMEPKILSEVLSIFDQICFVQKEAEISEIHLNSLKKLAGYLSGQSSEVDPKFAWMKTMRNGFVEKAAKSLKLGLSITEPQVPIEAKNVNACSGSQNETEEFVMLSYNWESTEVVDELANAIRNSGVPIWRDIEKMVNYGDINDGMADAVENCGLLVAVISEKYKLSKNCRRELEYADNRNKQFIFVKTDPKYEPAAWLGLMMGKKIYYIVDKNDAKTYEALIKAIQKSLNVRNTETDRETSPPKPVKSSTTKLFTHVEYKEWVQNNPAVKFLKKDQKKKLFNEFVIAGIVDLIKSESLRYVIEKLQKDFDLNASEAMTLVKVLETSYPSA